MNRIPRTRFVTLMAAAAGVTVGLGSMAEPAQARTPALTVSADTVAPSKPAAAKATKSDAAAPAKATEATKAKAATAAKKPGATAKAVVGTAAPSVGSENDACGSEADCRNMNGGGY